jgi:hypothetical protein
MSEQLASDLEIFLKIGIVALAAMLAPHESIFRRLPVCPTCWSFKPLGRQECDQCDSLTP